MEKSIPEVLLDHYDKINNLNEKVDALCVSLVNKQDKTTKVLNDMIVDLQKTVLNQTLLINRLKQFVDFVE